MKQIVGWLFVLVGSFCIGYAFYAMEKIVGVKHASQSVTQPIAENPMGALLEQTIQEKVNQYNTAVTWLFIGGTVFVFVGGSVLFFHRRP